MRGFSWATPGCPIITRVPVGGRQQKPQAADFEEGGRDRGPRASLGSGEGKERQERGPARPLILDF